jgi:hypothetical protein
LFRTARPAIAVEVHHQQAFEAIATWIERFRYDARWHVPGHGFPRVMYAWPAEVGRSNFWNRGS